MKHVLTVLTIAMLSSVASANILVNGGFETGDLTGWTLADVGTTLPNTAVIDGSTITPYEGDYQLDLSGNDRVYQIVDGAGITGEVLVQAFSRDEGSTGQKYTMRLYGLDAGYVLGSDGAPDSGGTLIDSGEAFLLDTYANFHGDDGFDGDGVWEFDVGTGYDYLQVYIWNNGNDSELNVFDGITMTPEPASMSLLAMGALALIRRRK